MGAALRPARVSETARDVLSGIAIELPRPYLFHTVKMAFSLLALVLSSIAVGLLIVYFMSP